MQKGKSIISIPLFLGMMLSIAIHSGALYSNTLFSAPQPQLKSGRRVVQLNLLSSRTTVMNSSNTEMKAVDSVDHEPLPEPAPAPAPATEAGVKRASMESEEQILNPPADPGIPTAARIRTGTTPAYPYLSQLRGEEGVVLLSIEVLATGKAGRIEMLKSSGYRRLDRAAIEAAQCADYIPARALGRSIDSQLLQPMTFKLTDPDE